MVLSECYRFIKYALVCLNTVFLAVGLAAVILALWVLLDQTYMASFTQEEHNFTVGIYILLAVGIIQLIISFMGCYGALRESQCMLVGFFCCLLVVIVAEIAAWAWLYSNVNRLEDSVKSSMIHMVKDEYGTDESSMQVLDAFQSGLGCCGATGPDDWAGSKYASKDAATSLSLTVSTGANTFRVPESCCKDKESTACTRDRIIKVADNVSPAIYSEGCSDKLLELAYVQSSIVIGVIIGFEILKLLNLIFSLLFCCAVCSSDRYKA